MPSLAASYSAFANAVYSTARHSSRHALKSRPRYASTLLTASHLENYQQELAPEPGQKTLSPEERIKQQRLEDLQYVLSGDRPSASRVWTYYTSLMNVTGYDQIPLEVHQLVLRHCAPSFPQQQANRTRQLQSREPVEADAYESRFQTVIRNIRASGASPDLEDYHFILKHFSTVGHHLGAMYVYKEIIRTGLEPRTKTFGLILQAISHRLSYPTAKLNLPKRVIQTRQMVVLLMADMQKYNIRFTSVNLDLIIRILKETLDMPTLEVFMKAGYGIDIHNPDHPPVVEHSLKAQLGFGSNILTNSNPLPFGTSALNTTLDILGRLELVSKMIQTFEVLTHPLPSSSQEFSSFDDDDDFGPGSGSGSAKVESKPPVIANSTTYCIMLRHLCRLGHHTLARHYINEAMFVDKRRDWGLRKRIYTQKSLANLASPRLAINRGMLVPVFGHSNRDKNLGLMRWLSTKLPAIIKRKKENIEWYRSARERTAMRHTWQEAMISAQAQEGTLVTLYPPKKVEKEDGTPDDGFAELIAGTPFEESGPVVDLKNRKRPQPDLFELNIESEQLPTVEPFKAFDVNLHLRILERDLVEIEQFDKYVKWILGRNTQRIKERLGRRVWEGKDIFLSTQGQRVKLEKSSWQKVANFKPRQLPEGGVPTSALPTRRNRAKKLPPMRPAAKAKDPKFSKFFDRSDNTVEPIPAQHGVFKDFAVLMKQEKQ